METQRAPGTYHHGNVKNALIEAAMALMESEDIENLSLRRLAREVGITPSAVYNHFCDKNALMLAIKRQAFADFNDYFDSSCPVDADCEEALMQMGLAYYRYSRMFPARFAVLFTGNHKRVEVDGEFLRMSCRTINRLRSIMLAIHRKYNVTCSEETVVDAVLIFWSQLHGLVTLKDSGSIVATVGCQGWPRSCSLLTEVDSERLVQTMVQNSITGLLYYHASGNRSVQ